MVRTHFLWPHFSQLTPLIAAGSLVILVLNVSRSAEPPETNASEVVVTAEAEPESPTSPSEEQAAEQKNEVPGGFSLRSTGEMEPRAGFQFRRSTPTNSGAFSANGQWN